MRIAFLTDSYWPRVNGVSVSVQSFRDELKARGHAVVVLCPTYSSARGRSGGDGILRFPSFPSGMSAEDRLVRADAFPILFRALDRFKPDVVFIQTEFSMYFAGRMYVRMRSLPLVLCSHTDYEHYIANYVRFLSPSLLQGMARSIMHWLYHGAKIVVTPSHAMAGVLESYGLKKKVHVLPSGVPVAFALAGADKAASAQRRAALEAEHPVLAGKRILLFAGRVTEEKGTDFLLPVLERILRERRDVALLIVGDGPHRAALQAHVAARGLSKHIAFAGYLPYEELPLVYAASDVFVFPSRTETLGLCTIEAMSTGLPVVAVGEMGTLDVMQGDHGGFMVKAEVEDFAAATLRLLNDEGLRRSKATEARSWSARFGIATAADQLVELFETLKS